jgi:hypothetical protein
VLLPFTRLALSAFLLYGIGYVVPLLRRDLDINATTAGLHASGIAIGTIIAGLRSSSGPMGSGDSQRPSQDSWRRRA